MRILDDESIVENDDNVYITLNYISFERLMEIGNMGVIVQIISEHKQMKVTVIKKPPLTLLSAFQKLIKQTNWFANSGYSASAASRDKKIFLSNKTLTEGRIRTYLIAAGWRQIQSEQWTE